MASNMYDSELVSGSDIKFDPSTFYIPTSFPQQQSNLQQQQQQRLHQGQQDQQFYSHTASPSYANLSDSFVGIPSPPPLEPDICNASTMNIYMGNGGYSQLPLNSSYADYYATSSNNGYGQGQAVPRSMEESYNLMLMSRYNLSQSHPGSEYHASPIPSPHSSHHGILVDSDWYNRRASLSRSHSPHDLRQATVSVKDEGEEIEDAKVELPYAKLIHKALMEAPNHAMSLQDIYKWFMENTEKGSSSGSGWRNSIRHNLSMNQAFRKSDKNTMSSPADGAPKKTSEWVLEPWAVADGVTPTTRYRQKVAKKASHRDASAINTSRQSAGKKGGNMAGRTKALRSREMRDITRVRSEAGSREGSLPRETGYEREGYGRGYKRQCTSEAFMRHSPPMDDPITPTASMTNGPYYGYSGSSHGCYEDPIVEPEYKLQDVQGMYPDDLYNNGPIFSHHAMPKYGANGLEYNAWVTTE